MEEGGGDEGKDENGKRVKGIRGTVVWIQGRRDN